MVVEMTQTQREDLVLQLNNALELERKVVGVKLLYTKEEFDGAGVSSLTGYLPYCTMVKSACSGASFKAADKNFGCFGASIALHTAELEDLFSETGVEYFTSGQQALDQYYMFKDVVAAKNMVDKLVILDEKAYGVMLRPLECFEEDPDVVIIVSNSYNAMRILQGYGYEYGTFSNFRLAGLQALCSETTAYPLKNKNINVSMLCAGTRQNCKWGRDEISIGIPYDRFAAIVNGVNMTINPLERDGDKKRIEENMNHTGKNVIDIEYGKNYDTGCYLFGEGIPH